MISRELEVGLDLFTCSELFWGVISLLFNLVRTIVIVA